MLAYCNITEHSHILYDQPLQNVSEAKYLGVISDFNFSKHIDSLCKKATYIGFFKEKLEYLNLKI